jgi:hypothetical protein
MQRRVLQRLISVISPIYVTIYKNHINQSDQSRSKVYPILCNFFYIPFPTQRPFFGPQNHCKSSTPLAF